MAYLDSNARTTKPTSNDNLDQMGRFTTHFGVFMGFVKDSVDVQRNGRLRVWIPEFGSAPHEEQGWVTVNYCSPFAGATNIDTISKTDIEGFDKTQTSYGMWMVPPDINNQVLVMFIGGDPSRGVWIGSMFDQFVNKMTPGVPSDSRNWQYPGKQVPVAEYNKWDKKVTEPDRAIKPYEKTKFKGVGNQGLITDPSRGTTTAGARREAPSKVFGILTPGPAVNPTAPAADIRRKGGSSFIMDDGTGTECIQLTTKSGAQVKIDETEGYVYLINRDGTAWVQMDKDGNVDIFGAKDISMRAQRDLNIRADRNINIEAGQNIFMKAAKDTSESTVEFTFDVNNIPKAKAVPVWNYVGEGKGDGGNIVMQALHNWQSTTQKGAFITVVENDMNVKIGNTLNVTTVKGGQNYSSKQGIKLTTDAAFDIAATGNIRVGTNGTLNVVASRDIAYCTGATMSLKASDNINVETAASISLKASSTVHVETPAPILFKASLFGVTAPTQFSSSVDIAGTLTVTGVANLLAAASVKASMLADVGPFAAASPPAPSPIAPLTPEPVISAAPARPAEVKPTNNKINILANWADPESKFKRNSQPLLTTVSRFPTFEPCPEHKAFALSSVTGKSSVITNDDKTYPGSAGPGNGAITPTPPAAAVNPGADNKSIKPDPIDASSVSKDINVAALKCQLIYHEGNKTTVYNDTLNNPTAGIGHLLRADEISQYPVGSPISASQVDTWYTQDSASAMKGAQELMGDSWGTLSETRKRAVTDLTFNLGKTKLSKFPKFISAMKSGQYDTAGAELKDSVWYGQVGKRGPNIIGMIASDTDTTGCKAKNPE